MKSEAETRQLAEFLLRRLGVKGTLKGYDYIVEGVLIRLESATSKLYMTKEVYPQIARKFNTTAHCVERNMRTTIGKAWESGKENIEKLTRKYNRRPANGEFLDAVAFALRETIREGGGNG